MDSINNIKKMSSKLADIESQIESLKGQITSLKKERVLLETKNLVRKLTHGSRYKKYSDIYDRIETISRKIKSIDENNYNYFLDIHYSNGPSIKLLYAEREGKYWSHIQFQSENIGYDHGGITCVTVKYYSDGDNEDSIYETIDMLRYLAYSQRCTKDHGFALLMLITKIINNDLKNHHWDDFPLPSASYFDIESDTSDSNSE